jgi:hypothetical protein
MMLRVSRGSMSLRSLASIVAAVAALLSLSTANAESVSDDNSSTYWARDVFAKILRDKTLRDQTAISDQVQWPDLSALSYTKSKRSGAPAATWLPQPLPAVDGINAKIDGYGGGANHSEGFYGATGSLSAPLAQQWGAQVDGRVQNADGIAAYGVAGHLFWRDPSIGLVGAYGSWWHWDGRDIRDVGHVSADSSAIAAQGEYYAGRWTLGGVAGIEMVSINAPAVLDAFVPNRFFDSIRASYYVTDNSKLSIGHVYSSGRHGLTLGAEQGFALGGGRMASLFAHARFAEGGHNSVLGGLRVYFGQRDKTLIDRHRQDDPEAFGGASSWDPPEPCGFNKPNPCKPECNNFGGKHPCPTP